MAQPQSQTSRLKPAVLLKPRTIFGQPIDVVKNQISALVWNIVSWLNGLSPIRLLPAPPPLPTDATKQAISISGPGGLDKLAAVGLGSSATVGYNVREFCMPSFTPAIPETKDARNELLPAHCVLVRIGHFSVNYADVTIRWGLYESASRYVGWPIVPGFDISGVVEWAGRDSGWAEGDKVFGFTLFGAYSTRCLVPGSQLMRVPAKGLTMAQAAAAPAVSATALHAVALAGFFPQTSLSKNRGALVHSAAGGVGSMLLQICRLCGFSPIVAVVGSPHKVDTCKELGAHHVIDKSSQDLWSAAREFAPEGYAAIFDANGISTLQNSFDHLAMSGRLIVYGFHSNLPSSSGALNPMNWIRMALGMLRMPHFDSMRMVLESKAMLGFNLSFFAEEHDLKAQYMSQLSKWLDAGELKVNNVTELSMAEIHKAHALIQSGKTVGKIVLRTPVEE